MPYSKLTYPQIEAVLDAQSSLLHVPGVTMQDVDFIDCERQQPALIVYVDPDHRSCISRIPTSVAGLPVMVTIEDPRTYKILETIDPRRYGGEWPTAVHCHLDHN